MTATPCNAVLKACTCCGRYYDSDFWTVLPLVGYVGGISDDERVCLELRNCSCGSTLAVEVQMPERVAA